MGVVIGTALMASPAASHFGTVSHLWKKHVRPKADDRYLRATIQPGETVRGTIGAQETVDADDVEVAANASLPRAAKFALNDGHVTVNNTPEDTGDCNGSVENPTAKPGWVCIYPYFDENIGVLTGYIWGGGDGEVKWGFQASGNSEDPGTTAFFATWAYKAPAHAPALARAASCAGLEAGGC